MVLLQYLTGFLWLGVMITFLYSIGTVLFEEERFMPKRLMIGYIVYSFFVAIVGIPCQLLNLEWKYFAIGLTAVWLFLIAYIIFKIRDGKDKIYIYSVKKFIKENWFLFVICVLFEIIMLSNVLPWWFNNHLDDGYYLNKVMELPYLSNPFAFNYSTGFLTTSNQFDIYLLSSHELELSAYCYIFRICPTLFCRVFVSGFHFFLLVNCITVFAKEIQTGARKKIDDKYLQFCSIIALLFCCYEVYLKNHNIIYNDLNQAVYALYYGSSIVRMMGFMFLLYPFLSCSQISIKLILQVVIISIVLISKSSIACPLIVVAAIAFVMRTLVINKKYFLSILAILFILALSIVLNSNIDEYISNVSLHSLINNTVFSIILLLGILLTFFVRNKKIKEFNLLLLIMIALIFCPLIQNISTLFSFYAFVKGRMITSLLYLIVVTLFTYCCVAIFSSNLSEKSNKHIIAILISCMTIFPFYTICISGGEVYTLDDGSLISSNPIFSWKVLFRNPEIIPNSTIKLGEELKRIQEDLGNNLNVVCPQLLIVNSKTHSLAVQLRGVCKTDNPIHIISAIYRYGKPKDGEFSDFSEDHDKICLDFISNPEQYADSFKSLIHKYPINCIVLNQEIKKETLLSLGFHLESLIEDSQAGVNYFVYVQ